MLLCGKVERLRWDDHSNCAAPVPKSGLHSELAACRFQPEIYFYIRVIYKSTNNRFTPYAYFKKLAWADKPIYNMTDPSYLHKQIILETEDIRVPLNIQCIAYYSEIDYFVQFFVLLCEN